MLPDNKRRTRDRCLPSKTVVSTGCDGETEAKEFREGQWNISGLLSFEPAYGVCCVLEGNGSTVVSWGIKAEPRLVSEGLGSSHSTMSCSDLLYRRARCSGPTHTYLLRCARI